ncbi:lysoplasmalogenase family protein [Caulobacter segnis]|uniref:lysoplasmalogenase family protein n=1 Tax=Caulobacter segnis TaxID=88688 RepID=UPI00240EE090|nr:lysoplasmalogenase family protein [Caulobacter segnis]MDG2523524.1 lysoplasmalogenase family protein [Caulobacter segnis]
MTTSRGGLPPNLILIAAIVAGLSYMASWQLPLPPVASTVWKGAAVSLLALYAGLKAQDRDGWLACAMLALYALGDVLLEVIGLTRGAVAFLAGHVVAMVLYLRNRQTPLPPLQLLLAIAVVPATVGISWVLPTDRSFAPGIALYALGLSLMAATALASRFSAAGAGLGGVLFVISDLLIFARIGPLEGQAWVGFGVWGLYLAGNVLICLAVVKRPKPGG